MSRTIKPVTPVDFVRFSDVARRLGVHRHSIRRWVQDGKLPPPIQLSDRVRGWASAEIERWLTGKGATDTQDATPTPTTTETTHVPSDDCKRAVEACERIERNLDDVRSMLTDVCDSIQEIERCR